ncbi:hypothetical protein DIPPA_35224, partial [Diplonema papillatum]
TAAPLTPAPLTKSPPTASPPTTAPPTPAPPTAAPSTTAPPTNAPSTTAPSTTAPPTKAPSTFAPSTFAPSTTAPPSAAPATVAASSTAPVTEAPKAEAPTPAPTPAPTTLSETQQKQLERASDVAVGAGVFTGSGIGPKLVVLKSFGCEVDDVDLDEATKLDWEFHPTQLAFGSDGRKFMTAAIVMNPVLFLIFWLFLTAVATSFYTSRKLMSWNKALGLARSPGMMALPFMFLIQGTSLISARIAFRPKDLWLTVLGWGIMAFCVISPCLLYLFLRRVPSRSLPIPDPILFPDHPAIRRLLENSDEPPKKPLAGIKRKLYRFAFGDIVWVSRGSDPYFAEKYGMLFEGYRPGCSFYMAIDVGGMILLSVLSAWRPSSKTECNVRNVVFCLLFFTLMLLTCVLRPFNSVFDNLISFFLTSGMFIAILLMTMSIWMDDGSSDSLSAVAGWLLILTAFVVFGKALWDLFLYLLDIYMERRLTARTLANENTNAYGLELENSDENAVGMTTFEPLPGDYFREEEVLSSVPSRRCSMADIVAPGPFVDLEEMRTPTSCVWSDHRRGSVGPNAQRCFLTAVPSEGRLSPLATSPPAAVASPPLHTSRPRRNSRATTPTTSRRNSLTPRYLLSSPRPVDDEVFTLPLAPLVIFNRQAVTPTTKSPRDAAWV